MKTLTILGSTGSIGVNTLKLIEEANDAHGGDAYQIHALVGGSNASLLAQQALKFKPKLSIIADPSQWELFKTLMAGSGLDIGCGEACVIDAASQKVDWVMAAIVGIAGLRPTWAAAGTGAIIALANKESLVCCGRALIERAEASGGRVLPVDSEHNAIFQVLEDRQKDKVSRLILTASGGPFRGLGIDELRHVNVAQALSHPNWSMGAKISIDSATLANKGLELIEAAYLFDIYDIDVLIHPQSVIHSIVEYCDGSSLAQMGPADMRVPISFCLGWPDRMRWNAPKLDLKTVADLSFSGPDLVSFPMLRLAKEALGQAGALPIIFNAANEVCVSSFLDTQIKFLAIAENVEMAMMRANLPSKSNWDMTKTDVLIDEILEIDLKTRRDVRQFMK